MVVAEPRELGDAASRAESNARSSLDRPDTCERDRERRAELVGDALDGAGWRSEAELVVLAAIEGEAECVVVVGGLGARGVVHGNRFGIEYDAHIAGNRDVSGIAAESVGQIDQRVHGTALGEPARFCNAR